jgi:hypothetical protein
MRKLLDKWRGWILYVVGKPETGAREEYLAWVRGEAAVVAECFRRDPSVSGVEVGIRRAVSAPSYWTDPNNSWLVVRVSNHPHLRDNLDRSARTCIELDLWDAVLVELRLFGREGPLRAAKQEVDDE